MTKHQYYLQLRKDILEERMGCDTENTMLLASLALQAEFGDYQPEVPHVTFNISMSLNNKCFIYFFFVLAHWENLL